VLDWVVAAARSGTAIDYPSFVGLTYLIDALWERWIEGDGDDGLGRSRALMQLGILEGDTLATGVPRMRFEAGEQPALGALAKSDLVKWRIRENHMRALIAEQRVK
jgi:Iap family predicted aminopeptidase